jgi:antitoxin FitA
MIAIEVEMAQVIVRNLGETVKRKLKLKCRPARHGYSMEEEIRGILRDAVKYEGRPNKGLGTEIAGPFKGLGLEKPIRELQGFHIKIGDSR